MKLSYRSIIKNYEFDHLDYFYFIATLSNFNKFYTYIYMLFI